MKKLVTVCAVLVTVTASLMATPIPGTYDSRTEGSTIIANVPYVAGAPVASFWDDALDVVGLFMAYGHPQWNIEAHNYDWYGDYGYIQLGNYDNAPWFGVEAPEVTSYFGQISGWTLDKTYTGDVLNLVFRGTAVLDQYNSGEYNGWDHTPMSPVEITFEMGFFGIPELGTAATSSEGQIFGTPNYFKVNVVPEPATMALLSLGGLLLRRKK